MKLNEFHAKNLQRQDEAFKDNWHDERTIVLALMSEVGELANAVVGVAGCEKRKAKLTTADIRDAIGDIAVYLSLTAHAYGFADLEAILADTFNHVSERAGSALRVEHDANV